MILLLGGQKGGTGKSTVATNLATVFSQNEYDVLLIDGNPEQGTSTNWASRREALEVPQVTCIEKSGNILKSIKALSEKYDVVIIDTGGQDSQELRTAILAADIIITPVRPSQSDIETLPKMEELVEKAREMNPGLKTKILITNAPTNPRIKILNEVRELLQGLDEFELLNSVLYYRKSYSDSTTEGSGVIEMKPVDKKAKTEIENLAAEIVSAYNTEAV